MVGLLEWWGGVWRVCECEMVCCGVVQAGSKWLWCLWWSVGLESVHSWERCLPFLLSETVGEPFTTLSVTGRTKPSCPMKPTIVAPHPGGQVCPQSLRFLSPQDTSPPPKASQDTPRPRSAPMWPQGAPGRPRRVPGDPRRPQEASRSRQEAPRGPRRPPGDLEGTSRVLS